MLDTAVSSPEHDCGKGVVYVLDAGSGTTVSWTRDTSGVLGTAACDDAFGSALAVGDFDGDGYDDLAIGAPGGEDPGETDGGAVHVLYGSSTGLTATGDQLIHQDTTGLLGEAENDDQFAGVLTTSDFNCDGYADLVVGVPRDSVGAGSLASPADVLAMVTEANENLWQPNAYEAMLDAASLLLPAGQDDRFAEVAADMGVFNDAP